MREESHLDDMRSAIRGDFERLAERLGGQELMRQAELEDEPVAPQDADDEPELAAEQELPEEAHTPSDESSPDEPPRRSLLDRLLGR